MVLQRPSGFIEPWLPSKAARPPSGPLWIHEIKHDGYRLMVRRGRPEDRSVLVRGDRLHQGHQLTLHRLVLDLAVSAQEPEAEGAVEEEEAFNSRALPSPS